MLAVEGAELQCEKHGYRTTIIFGHYANHLLKGPNKVNTMCQVWWYVRCKGKIPYKLGHPEGMGCGKYHEKGSGKVSLRCGS